jgi:hypothetical protein
MRRCGAKTIHKSQGQTEKVGPVAVNIVSTPQGLMSMAIGQLYYVALSRTARWSQIVLLFVVGEDVKAGCGESKRVVIEMRKQGILEQRLMFFFLICNKNNTTVKMRRLG